jgi:hypothetical protein
MWSARKTAIWLVFFAVERILTAQIPLLSHREDLDFYNSHFGDDLVQWDLDEPHAVNATSNLVFETANSLLQHWANTRYRIGRLQQLGSKSYHLTFMHLYIVQVTQLSRGLFQ